MPDPKLTLDDVFQLTQLQFNAVNRAFEATKDPVKMQKLLDEMTEFSHRLDLIQRQRMDELGDDVSQFNKDMKAANTALSASLKSLSDINKVLDACTEFLGVVDQVIDLLKLV